jgi:hypothetical protein
MKPHRILNLIKNWLIFGLVIILLYGGWRFVFAHFHPLPYCNISIRKDILRGDTRSIREALSTLRRTNTEAYKTVCRYVDRIEEKRCFNADGHVDDVAFQKTHDGCYIGGSRTIYLMPQEYSADLVARRADSIKALAEKSREFWGQ